MSNVVRTDIDALNAVLTITIPKEVYVNKVKKDIQKYSQKAQMKGFRPGKTPPQLVRKIYGNEFLMDAVQENLSTEISTYLDAEKIDMFGQPMLSEDQPKLQLSMNDPQDAVFKFDIGLTPKFELQGLDGVAYTRFVVEIEDKTIDDEILGVQKKLGKEQEVEGLVQAGDLLTLEIKEMGGTLEKDLMLSVDWLTDDMKSVFFTQSKGDSLQINIFQLERDTTADYVRKYFLGLEEHDIRQVNENFHATIKTIKRQVLGNLDVESLEKAFGPGITTEDEARTEIRANIAKNFDSQSDALLLRDLQNRLIEENQFDLPHTFLKRWIKSQNEKNSDAVLEKEYPHFVDNLRWTMVRSAIAKSSDIVVTEEDIREFYGNKIRGYFGGMPVDEGMISTLVDRVFENEKQVNELYEEVLTESVFEAMKSRITMVDKTVSNIEFREILTKAQAEAAKLRDAAKEELAGIEV